MKKMLFVLIVVLAGLLWFRVPIAGSFSLLLVLSLGLAAAAYPAWRAIQPHLAAILKEE
jgi:ABC-type antimicrobial peptide transport system permease subunit